MSWDNNQLTWESIRPSLYKKTIRSCAHCQPAPVEDHAHHLVGGEPIGKVTLRTFFGDFRWLEENWNQK